MNHVLAPLDRMRIAGAEVGGMPPADPMRLPQRWALVVGEENDYLRCKPFTGVIDQVTAQEIKVAKPQSLRGGSIRWGVYPAYIASVSVIVAIPNGQTDVVDADDAPIPWVDSNINGRRADVFWAEITGSAAWVGEDNRWKYAWTEQVQTGADTFADLSGGRSGTTTTGYAINTVENSNDDAGVQGHGVDIDGADYPAGFSVQPIQGVPALKITQTQLTATTWAYAFTRNNADDGTCEAP